MSCCGPQTDACCVSRNKSTCEDGVKFQKKLKPLLYDAIGPYPDEMLMTVLDRLLYYTGATKIIHLFEMSALEKNVVGGNINAIAAAAAAAAAPLPGGCGSTPPPVRSPSCSSCVKQASSNCSLVSILCPKPKSSCSSNKAQFTPCSSCFKIRTATPTSKSNCPQPSLTCRKSSVTNIKPSNTCRKSSVTCLKPSPTCYSRISVASSCPRQRSPRVDFANAVPVPESRQTELRQEAGGSLSMSDRMKLSLSLCSMACRNLKDKMPCCSSSCITKESNRSKWLWTRLVNSMDGCKVYEVYKDSNVNQAPCKLEGSQEPVIIFLVMPNGYIMPFESLSF